MAADTRRATERNAVGVVICEPQQNLSCSFRVRKVVQVERCGLEG